MAGTHERVRVYASLRTAHLERARRLEPATVVFLERNYDFDLALANGLELVHAPGVFELARFLLRNPVHELEINEPLMLGALKYSLVATVAVRVSAALRGRRAKVVTYAIENAPTLSSPSRRLRTPVRRVVYRLAVRLVLAQVDRIAFGTTGALERYRELTRRPRSTGALIPAISSPCECLTEAAASPRAPQLLFLGAFDHRKGVLPLLQIWPEIAAEVAGARLLIMGQGELESVVQEAVGRLDAVEVVVAPSRLTIHEGLRSSSTLVLWSQSSSTWREQVGLPLVEGLAHGCRVVASDETGIADWLVEHGHAVAPLHEGSDGLRRTLVAALRSGRTPREVIADLPSQDGRLAADAWLWQR